MYIGVRHTMIKDRWRASNLFLGNYILRRVQLFYIKNIFFLISLNIVLSNIYFSLDLMSLIPFSKITEQC